MGPCTSEPGQHDSGDTSRGQENLKGVRWKMGQMDGNGKDQGLESTSYGTGGRGGSDGKNRALIRGGVNVVDGEG